MPRCRHEYAFERYLSVSSEDIELELRGHMHVAWADFLLNPRRLRGSDFLMRWSQGVWSEEIIVKMVNRTRNFRILEYGPSGTAPDNDPRAFELYFEKLEQAGLGDVKRPDLLVFCRSDWARAKELVKQLGGKGELPFVPETNPRMQELLGLAVLAVECENSLWRASQMPAYGLEMKPQKRLGGRLGFSKNAVLPTVIIKEQDREPLLLWQEQHGIPIHIWHVFYDLAFGLSLDKAEALIAEGLILPTDQTFQAPSGATTKKTIYKFYYHYAYPLGVLVEEPELVAAAITDKNGHILPYVKFQAGRFDIAEEAAEVLAQLCAERS